MLQSMWIAHHGDQMCKTLIRDNWCLRPMRLHRGVHSVSKSKFLNLEVWLIF